MTVLNMYMYIFISVPHLAGMHGAALVGTGSLMQPLAWHLQSLVLAVTYEVTIEGLVQASPLF